MNSNVIIPDRADKLTGVLLGMAAGDALGLPREGLTPRRAARLYGEGPLEHRFFFGRGMLSDDTEHACMTAQALLASGGDEVGFARSLAHRLRGWLLALPAAVGWGTLRAILKLWMGFSPSRSGVLSAGNGPAMRAPMLGACLAHAPERIEVLVRASTRVTHRDPRAEEGARLIALAAAEAARCGPGELRPLALLRELRARARLEEFCRGLDEIDEALAYGPAAEEVFGRGRDLSRGVSGYVVDTVIAALFAWLMSPANPRGAIERIIRFGGDADTTGAIVGGLSGATVGAGGLPVEWVDGIADWPRSVSWMRRLGERLAMAFPDPRVEVGASLSRAEARPLPLFWPAIPMRNMFFLWVALAHGFRRLLPPY